MRKVLLTLFYLLLLFFPTQLGKHFFFDFSSIVGLRSDYLSPTIYLTDIIIGLMIGLWIFGEIRRKPETIASTLTKSKIKNINYWLFAIGYLLFTSIFIAENKWVAIYKTAKIIEFILLGFLISRLKPKWLTVISFLAFDVIYTSAIALSQFFLQRSIGGIFWFLGERSFYAGTPSIALIYLAGRFLLRSYSIFSHPNVFGGFLAVVLPLLLFALLFPQRIGRNKFHKFFRILFLSSFFLGIVGLILSFSRAAWLVGFLGFILVIISKGGEWSKYFKKTPRIFFISFYSLIIFSFFLPLFLPPTFSNQSFLERKISIIAAIQMIAERPLFGVGLNNFIVHLHQYVFPTSNLFIFQPVHNLYLLIFAETGLIGFILGIVLLTTIYYRSLFTNFLITIVLTQILLLGFFDHYLFTLQQGQILLTIFAALAVTNAIIKKISV